MEPHIIKLLCIGSDDEGFLTVADASSIPFLIKRVFWTVNTPQNVIRGKHAHKNTNMVLIAAKGEIIVNTIDKNGFQNTFHLNKSDEALFLPILCWHEMTYSKEAVQIVITDTEYDAFDYVRDKTVFYDLISMGHE